MRHVLLLSVIAVLPALAVDGTVINRTTGKPAVDATVTLYKLGQETGLEALESVHTDARGAFHITQQATGGPHLIQTAYQGVTYNHMLPPGSASSGITLEVFDAIKQAGEAKVKQHFLILQPAAGQMTVSEVFMYANTGKTTYNDPDGGTLKFYLPPDAKGIVKIRATAPGGMPIERVATKSGKPDIYKVDFAIKPGETQFELNYVVPYASPARFGGKDVAGSPETLLVAPAGVEIKGDGIEFNRQEPRSKANIYSVKGARFEVEITGNMQPSETGQADDSGSGPSIEQVMPKLFGQIDGSAGLLQKLASVKWILLLAMGILALGFMLLYRAQPPVETVAPAAAKDKHERRRR